MEHRKTSKLARFVAGKYGLGEEWANLPPGASGDDPEWIEQNIGDWPQPEPPADELRSNKPHPPAPAP